VMERLGAVVLMLNDRVELNDEGAFRPSAFCASKAVL